MAQSTAASNRQTAEYMPLMTLQLPDGLSDASGNSRFYFQITDPSGSVVDDDVTYQYLAGYMDNISGSMIPYSAYKYTIRLANNSVSSVVTNVDFVESGIQSLLDFINENDGLRNCILLIKYRHRDTTELNSTGRYRIDRTILATESIMIELLADMNNIIPAVCI